MFPTQRWELAATEASAGELWDKEWLREVLACEHKDLASACHALLVTRDKVLGPQCRTHSLAGQQRWLRDGNTELVRARQETGQVKGQNNFIKVTPQVLAKEAQNREQIWQG